MRLLLAIALVCAVSACQVTPKETYPYGMTESEWNELSIKDKARIRRDFYFYEKGHINFVNPNMDVEGRKVEPYNFNKNKKTPELVINDED